MARNRHMDAARDLADLLKHASPDVAAANAGVADALAADVRAELHAAYRLVDAQTGKPAGGAAPSEHDEQCALFAWAEANADRWPELALMFAIPNGGHRHPAVAAQLKAEGVRAGVPDVLLLCRRGGYAGMALELKRRDHSNGPTPEQRDWLARLNAAGYKTVVCYGADEAITAILHYLAQNGPEGE